MNKVCAFALVGCLATKGVFAATLDGTSRSLLVRSGAGKKEHGQAESMKVSEEIAESDVGDSKGTSVDKAAVSVRWVKRSDWESSKKNENAPIWQDGARTGSGEGGLGNDGPGKNASKGQHLPSGNSAAKLISIRIAILRKTKNCDVHDQDETTLDQNPNQNWNTKCIAVVLVLILIFCGVSPWILLAWLRSMDGNKEDRSQFNGVGVAGGDNDEMKSQVTDGSGTTKEDTSEADYNFW